MPEHFLRWGLAIGFKKLDTEPLAVAGGSQDRLKMHLKAPRATTRLLPQAAPYWMRASERHHLIEPSLVVSICARSFEP